MEIKERKKKDKFYKTNPSGISLIILVITIIVIIILATAVIVTILDNNPINSAKKAVDESNVAKYTEQIEQIRSKLLLQSENHELPNLQQMKEALEKEKWAVETEMIMDEGIEKLKIVSKEGYIFYITEDDVEYKGKGEVVDTSALKRDDVLELVAEDTTSKGQYVKITSKAEEYYVIKYKIGEEENSWTEIKSEEIVEVPYGKTIYAKLFYGSSSGVEFKLKIGESNPSIVAKNTDTSNMKRKTDIAFANLFDITWGSEGIGSIAYEVTGNMLFKNTSYNNAEIENTKELELGTYNIKCTITSLSNYQVSAQKQVKITTLASTTVINASNNIVNANAIYSEYDLSYFRDLVNGGQPSENAKLMYNINLTNVCSSTIGSWTPIANIAVNENLTYNGIFDGDNKTISGLYINTSNNYQGLFGINNGEIYRMQIVSGSISSGKSTGVISSQNYGKISECGNKINITTSQNNPGGIVSKNYGTINKCYNIGNITTTGTFNSGGIVGVNYFGGVIDYCYNSGTISGINQVGGISGSNTSGTSNSKAIIRNSYNIGLIKGTGLYVGSISGYNGANETYRGGIIENCYFLTGTWKVGVETSYKHVKTETFSKNSTQMKAFTLDNIFVKDTVNKNDGYPILKWQLEH